MGEGQKGKEDDKAKKVDLDRFGLETARLNELEMMLKTRVQAAEELSRKRCEISEMRVRTDDSGPQRKRRREERQEDAEKNKKKRSEEDKELRKKRRVVKHAEKRSRSKDDRVERDVPSLQK